MTLVPGKVVCDCVVEPSINLREDQVNVTTNAFSLLKASTSALTIKNLHCANRVFNHSRCPKFTSTITMFSILSFNWFLNESASRHFQLEKRRLSGHWETSWRFVAVEGVVRVAVVWWNAGTPYYDHWARHRPQLPEMCLASIGHDTTIIDHKLSF